MAFKIQAIEHATVVARQLATNKSPGELVGDEIVVTDESGAEVFRLELINA